MVLLSFSFLEAKENKNGKEFKNSGKSYGAANKNDNYKRGNNTKNKHMKKTKDLSKGLQKKYERTGQLPKGWQKKLKVGSFVSKDVLSQGKIVEPKKLNTSPESGYSKIYEIEDKIIRINTATRAIIEVFK
jgi:hypothetical protein